MLAIVKKELRTYFTGVTGYIFLGFLVLVTAIFYGVYNIDMQSAIYSYTLSVNTISFFILIPTLTMRLFAEEARQKTDQLLYTSPVNIWQIVVGKYLSAFMLFLAGMIITMLFPLMLNLYGKVPFAETAGAFAGFILLGGAFIAVGLFISVLTDSQIASAVATFAVVLAFFLMTAIKSSVPADPLSSLFFVFAVIAVLALFLYSSTKSAPAGIILGVVGALISFIIFLVKPVAFDGTIAKFLGWFSVLERFTSFTAGVLAVSDIVYFLTFSAAFIYLTINVIERRRWK